MQRGAAEDPTPGSRVKEGFEQVRRRASDVAQEARLRGKERLERSKDAAADQVGQLGGALQDAAGKLMADNTFASYAAALGRRLIAFAESLQERSIDELAEDARALARRNPAVFIVGSVALGVALSRFLKASARRERGAG